MFASVAHKMGFLLISAKRSINISPLRGSLAQILRIGSRLS